MIASWWGLLGNCVLIVKVPLAMVRSKGKKQAVVSQAQNFIIIGDAVIIELMARLYKDRELKSLVWGIIVSPLIVGVHSQQVFANLSLAPLMSM